MTSVRPLTLLILDGWGQREPADDNAITLANTPCMDQLLASCTHTSLSGSGLDVGLPAEQMGNSEVGHLNIGAGRVVRQEFSRITHAIESGEFGDNEVLSSSLNNVAVKNSALHVLGLLSPGGVHSHEDHIVALCQMAKERGIKKLYLHAFLDGRDTPPRSAKASLERMDGLFEELGIGEIATLSGRYYAMDRDGRWERIEMAYRAIFEGKSEHNFSSAIEALTHFYDQDTSDEFVPPSTISINPVNEGDEIIFCNFRADRARQLSHAIVDKNFPHFSRPLSPEQINLVTFTEYESGLNASVAFPPLRLDNVLGSVLEQRDMKQLRIAETEKYAHVTFFFNGGVEKPFKGEDRELIPSPKVATYDLQPEMNAPLLTDKLVTAIESENYDVIICNYANPDMVGHTGNLKATIKAIECIDQCLARVIAASEKVGGLCLITADHGNAEQMHCHKTQQSHTAHTCESVPFIVVSKDKSVALAKSSGTLSDIAPTMLYILGIPQPDEMTGQSLITFN